MTFVPGLELSRDFYREAVQPILADAFPDLDYAAALIGSGSEVLGFDSERSTDHHWGPRVMLFLPAEAMSDATGIRETLSVRLPAEFRGYSTHFGPPDAIGVRLRRPAIPGQAIAHRVETYERRAYFVGCAGFDPIEGVSLGDWLATPSQLLLELTAGDVFHDPVGELTATRAALTWYPRDVWLYLMACQWQRIAEHEAFVGRCAEAGDDLGSRVVAASIVRDVMRLCFLIERRYAPYDKWLGTAFARLSCAPSLAPMLRRAMDAATYSDREVALRDAYELVAGMHNRIGATPIVDVQCRPYYDRPFSVIRGDRFADALRARISDPRIRVLPLVGAIDQFVDNVAGLSAAKFRAALANLIVE